MIFPDYLLFSNSPHRDLTESIEKLSPDKVAILVDENTKKHCLPILEMSEATVIEIPSGEVNKTLSTCENIWSQMTKAGMTRNSLLINVGGGVIGDMGGFCASTFKRGIKFINIPTTLLAMVDASIGGKLGVDFNGLKNHIGIFGNPEAVILAPEFLNTLPSRQLKSGFAEVLKHALICDSTYWAEVSKLEIENVDWSKVIERSVAIKNDVVNDDFNESGKRKILNFGHTFGHAIETYFLDSEQQLLHGEAIAIGMVLEAHLSCQRNWITEKELDAVTEVIKNYYSLPTLPPLEELMDTMLHDKKNQHNTLSFSLIHGIGNCEYDVNVNWSELTRSLEYYKKFR